MGDSTNLLDALLTFTLSRLVLRCLNNFIVQPARFTTNNKTQLSISGSTRYISTMSIQKIFARMIFDSRGNPTVEVDLTTEKGLFRAAVPSGASTGVHEALELRDNVKAEFHGKGVKQAISNVNDIIVPALLKENIDVTDQTAIDNFLLKLDGTENKLAMQEFMIFPTGATSFSEAMRMGSEVYHHLKKVINARFGLDATAVGDEGGFAPNILDNKDALNLISTAIEKAGYTGKLTSEWMWLLPNFSEMASTIWTSRILLPIRPLSWSLASCLHSTRNSSKNSPWFPLKIHSTRTIGLHGPN